MELKKNMDFTFISNIFQQIIISVFALLAITNPFGNLPVFISMTDDLNEQQREKLFRNVVFTAVLIVLIFAMIGTVIMEKFFQVDLAELRIAGGILLIAMGTRNLLYPQESREHPVPGEGPAGDDAIHGRIIPMAFPMLVGPGTLSTVIIIDNEQGIFVTIGSILIAFALIMLLFSRTRLIERLLGKLTLHILSRIMQVFIMAIGAKMLVVGLRDVFPVLMK